LLGNGASLVGDICFVKHEYKAASLFYEAAWQETSYFTSNIEKSFLAMKLAKAYLEILEESKALKFHQKAISYIEDEEFSSEIIGEMQILWNM